MHEDSATRGEDAQAHDGAGPSLQPLEPRSRIEILDILRGIAILGILLVNVRMFFAPIYLEAVGERWFGSWPDRVADGLVTFLAQGKFYTLFSLLFGVGAALQLGRCERRGVRFGPFFARRLIWLLCIGLAHAVLIWFGDILVYYALVGFLLIPFARRRPATLAVWALILLALPLALLGGIVGLIELAPASPELEQRLADEAARNRVLIEATRATYSTGSYAEILPARIRQWTVVAGYSLLWSPNVLAMFLIGFGIGRRRLLERTSELAPAIRRALVPLLLLGVVANAGLVLLGELVDPSVPSPAGLLMQLCFTLGAPALALFYAGGLTLLALDPSRLRRLRPLAPVGRMALSNYLLHSVAFTLLANGYGGGLYGRVSPAAGLALAVGVFALQIPASRWWLRRFRFGPLEWLWRSLTYGRLQPMRRPALQPG